MGKKAKQRKREEKRAYEAAMSTPSRRRVVGANQSQDAAADRALPYVRDWGRYLDENHDLASGVLDDLVKNIVGSGILTIPKPLREDGTVDEVLGVQLLKLWREWIRRADVTGELGWHEAQRLICRAWMRDGEEFLQHVAGRTRGYRFNADEVPYRVELLESQMCPEDYTQDGFRQGISHNAWGQPLRYAIYIAPPDDFLIGTPAVTLSDLKFVDADVMTHLKVAKRWPATRGMSVFSTVVSRLYDIKDLEESERLKNRVLSSWCAAVKKSPDVPGWEQTDDQGNRYLRMSSGTIIDTLAPGEDIVGVGPDYPVASMPDHIADQIRRVSSGTGTRYSSIARRYDGNYAAQRQEMVESEGLYQMREDAFVQRVCRTVYERWFIAALLDGKVALGPGMDMMRAANAEYRGPVTPWIDPKKEVEADKLAVDAGFASIDQIRIKRGAPEEMIGTPPPASAQPAPARPPAQLSLIDDEDAEEEEEEAA